MSPLFTAFYRVLRKRAKELLRSHQWPLEQISGCLRSERVTMVGKSTLYKWLHEDKCRGGDLYGFCRHGLRYRRLRLAQPKNSKKRGRYKNILERPEIVTSQGRMGDLEMDLILGEKPNGLSLGVPAYFACPYRSADKPHIEHANALIRQHLPKRSSFAGLTAQEIKEIEWRLNNRPRKKLGYRTPDEVFYLNLHPKCCTS